jgi:hypothetical protein
MKLRAPAGLGCKSATTAIHDFLGSPIAVVCSFNLIYSNLPAPSPYNGQYRCIQIPQTPKQLVNRGTTKLELGEVMQHQEWQRKEKD